MNKYKWLAALTLVASSLFADCCNDNCCNTCDPCGQDCCGDPCSTCCEPCNTCACSPCCCEPCDFCPPEPPETCAYNAPKFYDLKCSWDMFVTGSFVYMQAKEENLRYVQTRVGIDSTNALTSYVGTLAFDYKPAFKVGLGFTFGCDNWDFYAEYFRYHGDVGSGSFSQELPAGDEDFIACIYNIGSIVDNAISVNASTKWRLEMDMVDLNLRRKHFVGRCLVMQPSIGIKFGWIDQKQTNNYSTTTFDDDDNETTITTLTMANSSKAWAVGAKVGLDTEWTFCDTFRLFGNTSFAMLYTDYDPVKRTGSGLNNVNGVDQELALLDFSTTYCFLRPDASIILGLGWGDYWCCNDWYFDLSAGYEFHTYWNQNVLPVTNSCTFDPAGLFGDLFMHGLVLTARLDF